MNQTDNTKAFNTSQRNALVKICKALREDIKNLRYYVAYWDENGKFESRELNITKKSDQEPHCFLNYYWAVYQRGDERYRITMYYKDFDHGSGNIHVYPGAVQVWKRMCLEEKTRKSLSTDFAKRI